MSATTTRRAVVSAALLAAPAPAKKPNEPKSKKDYWVKPKPAKPLYSEALAYGDLVFVASHGVANGTIGEQTSEVLGQLKAALEAAGSSMDKALKCTVYLTKVEDFEGMNKAYLGAFGDIPPTRTTVAIAGLALPGCLVSIDVMAHK